MRIDDCKNQQSKSNDVLQYYLSLVLSLFVSRDPNASNQSICRYQQKTVAGTFVHVSIDLCLHEYNGPSSTISTHSINNNRQQ